MSKRNYSKNIIENALVAEILNSYSKNYVGLARELFKVEPMSGSGGIVYYFDKIESKKDNMNQEIVLKSDKLIVTKILKESSAQMFKHLRVGDQLLLSILVAYAGKSTYGATLASYIRIENLTTRECTTKTFNQIEKYLKEFEYRISEF